MTMKQLSVFVENKPGTLAEITGILGANDIAVGCGYRTLWYFTFNRQ